MIGGFVNVPEAFGGNAKLHEFLSPVITTEKTFQLTSSKDFMLMGVSVAVAVTAIIIALAKYIKKPNLANRKAWEKLLQTNGMLMKCIMRLL